MLEAPSVCWGCFQLVAATKTNAHLELYKVESGSKAGSLREWACDALLFRRRRRRAKIQLRRQHSCFVICCATNRSPLSWVGCWYGKRGRRAPVSRQSVSQGRSHVVILAGGGRQARAHSGGRGGAVPERMRANNWFPSSSLEQKKQGFEEPTYQTVNACSCWESWIVGSEKLPKQSLCRARANWSYRERQTVCVSCER